MEGLKKEYIYLKEVAKFSYGLEKLAKLWVKQKLAEENPSKSFKRKVDLYTKLDRETGEKYYEVVCINILEDIEILPEEEE